MYERKIIVRFGNKNDLDVFNNDNGTNFTKNTKSFNCSTGEIKTKISKLIIKSNKLAEWESEWVGMPEYISNKQDVYAKIDFVFDGDTSLNLLEELFQQKITEKTKSIWFPKLISGAGAGLRVVGGDIMPKYPIYVVSKGRANLCQTSKRLTQMELKHFVVVEKQEYEDYKKLIGNKYAKIIILDEKYKENYDTFWHDGDKRCGAGAARNFAWEHSIKNGFSHHWVMDDNVDESFYYMNNNIKQKCKTGTIFAVCEEFVNRYSNIAISGLNYAKFCKSSDKTPPYVKNTRIYSFLLIKNDISYRWRGRYNEDTDLSLRVLKDGWCTVQFNVFLAGKTTTQRTSGGNTAEFYEEEGTLNKSKMLQEMHPDVCDVVWKFNRWHHEVNYKPFKNNKLIKKEPNKTYDKINNFGMVVIDTDETNTNNTKSFLEEKYLKKN